MKHLLTEILPKPKVWALIGLIAAGCGGDLPTEPEFDNPLDPDSPTGTYVAPETSILSGPADGEVVDNYSVTFSWSGNERVTEYSFRLTSGEWSQWGSAATVTLSPLDEGDYTFEVKGRYLTGDEDDTPDTRSFTIDDIQGPALWLSPRKVEVANGSEFTLSLMAEDVTDLKALLVVVEFDPTKIALVSWQLLDQTGQFLTQHNANVIALVDSSLSTGSIGFNLALAGGDQLGVDGSGIILNLTLRRTAAGNNQIILGAGSRMINSDLAEVTIIELAPTEVVVP